MVVGILVGGLTAGVIVVIGLMNWTAIAGVGHLVIAEMEKARDKPPEDAPAADRLDPDSHFGYKFNISQEWLLCIFHFHLLIASCRFLFLLLSITSYSHNHCLLFGQGDAHVSAWNYTFIHIRISEPECSVK